MIGALLVKNLREARLLLGSLVLLLFAFIWLFVWLASTFDTGAFELILRAMPQWFERMIGVPLAGAVTPAGRIALGYIDPIVVLSITAWSISRGTDCVAGEIGRGTMEFLLAQPVRRAWIIVVHAGVTMAGAAVLAVAVLAGTWVGLKTVPLPAVVPISLFLPAAVNLFGLMVFLAGLSTLVSSLDHVRWRPVGVVCGLYAVALAVKMVARLVPDYAWLMRFTFLGPFEPQRMIIETESAWELCWRYNAWLIGLGLAAYLIATLVFCRRDLPAPV